MNSFPVMDWNTKWDLENLVIYSSKASESPKKLQPTFWGIEEGELDAVSFNLSGGGGGGGGSGASGSDMALGSSAKSSISASTDSSSKEGMKTSNFIFEGFPEGSNKKKEIARNEETGITPPLEVSIGSGEPLIGLKLGKRTYFENNCAESSAKISPVAVIPNSSATTAKKIKSSCQSTPPPRCQVEGCNLDLSSSKEYHRKHKVCESHSKCSKVTVNGLERRFCQQCSRFHSLSEFDEKKRSCRRRLSDHNARRRKPQQEAIQFDSTRLSSSFYGGRQHMSFELNNVPLIHKRPAASPTWESTCHSKFTLTNGCILDLKKAGGIDGHPHSPGIQLPHAISMLNSDSNRLLPCKDTTAEEFNQGLKESMFSSSLDEAPDLPRALSLLSTNSWGSQPESITLDHPMHVDHGSMPQPMMHAVPQGLPLASSGFWQTGQQSTDSRLHSSTAISNRGNNFEGIQLFKAPYMSGFYSNGLN